MATPFTLRRSAGGSTLRGAAGHTLRGIPSGATVISHDLLIIAFNRARAGPPGSKERP